MCGGMSAASDEVDQAVVNLLLIEDNPADVFLVREALAQHGVVHRLQTIADGDEALALLEVVGKPGGLPCPDLILVDLNLPKADGSEFVSALRDHPHCGTTPTIVLTSSSSPRDRAVMTGLGVAHYFQKPMDLEAFMHLGAVVKKVLDKIPGSGNGH